MQNPTPHPVARNVRAEMSRRRITQAVVARHLNLSQSSVSLRLTGSAEFKVSELQAVAELLGVSTASLLLPVEVAA
ncbi:MAG TPA: helix-turn-helix transcriptional regulator [Propionibacteriaceae bacterium]